MLTNFSFVYGQGRKKTKALKKINTLAQAEVYIKRHGPTSASIGNFIQVIDSVEYNEIKAAFRIGDIFFDKKSIYKILANVEEPLYRCDYIFFDGNKMSKNKIDSLRSEIIKQYKAGVFFKSLAKQFSMDTNLNEGHSGWFHPSKMGEDFCLELDFMNLGDIYLFDNPSKKAFYVVLKTHEFLCADSWVFVAI